jgi:mRNA-degrading endonuclease RelE of RelBE toxin-antitoxin system
LEVFGNIKVYDLRFLGKALDDLKRVDRAHQRIIKEKLLVISVPIQKESLSL